AMIAVAATAGWLGGIAAAGFSGFTATAVQAGVGAAVTLAGSLAINALIPPKMPSAGSAGQSPNVRQSVTGTRNQADPYGVVPRVYGNPRWYPKLAANPITEIAGNDQYLRMLLCLGYGPLEVVGHRVGIGHPLLSSVALGPVGDSITISETSLDEYDGVDWEIGTYDQLTIGYPDIQEESVGAALNATGPVVRGGWVSDTNVSAVRTTAPGTKEISIDLSFPQGLFTVSSHSGGTRAAGARFRVEYRATGTGSWVTV